MIKLDNGGTVLFTGDSITHGGRGLCMDGNHILGHGYQEIVCGRIALDNLEKMPKFMNKGVSGRSMRENCEQWETDVLPYRPVLISLLAGINDTAKALDEDTDAFVKRFISYVDSILKRTFDALPDVKFFVCEPFYLDAKNRDDQYKYFPHPVCESDFVFGNKNHDEKTVAKYREKLSAISSPLCAKAKEYGAFFVPFQDLFDKMSQTVHPSYLVWDNIHPTFVGHRLMAERWIETAEKALG
jgi:lysophospholipase L1-like esterase